MNHRHILRLLGMALALACLNQRLRAADPAPSGKEYLQDDFYRDIHAACKKDLGDTYRSSGRHDPAWDAAAQAALDLLADFDAAVNTDDVAQPGVLLVPQVKEDDLGAAAQKAIDAGCNDPMVCYARALALAAGGHAAQAAPFIERAAAALEGSPYSAREKLRVLSRHYLALADPAARTAAWPAIEKCCRELISGPFLNAASHREAALRFQNALALLPPDQAAAALARIAAAEGVDPWIIEMTQASRESGAAWQANLEQMLEVSKDDGAAGQKDQAAASALAQKAYALHPEMPEAATQLAWIATQASDQMEAEKWFQRGTAAQSDYAPAYENYFNTLASADADGALAQGTKAAAGSRFDTSIPWEYLEALNVAAGSGGLDIYNRPEVEGAVESIIGKYIAQWKGKIPESYFQTCLAAFHCNHKNYDRAKQALDQVPDPVNPEPFGLFHLSAQAAVEDTYLNTASDRQGVARFRQAANRGNYDNASRFLRQVITRDKSTGRELDILQREQACAQLMSDFASGHTLALTQESSLPFWRFADPPAIDQGEIVTDGGNFNLNSHFYFNDRHYHLHIAFEFMDVGATRGKFFDVGWGLGDNRVGWSMGLTGDPPRVDVQAPISADLDNLLHVPLSDVPAKNVIDIVYFDGDPVLTINGKIIPLHSPVPDVLEKLPAKNTLSISTNAPVRISEISLEHLTEKPAPGAAQTEPSATQIAPSATQPAGGGRGRGRGRGRVRPPQTQSDMP